MPAYKKRSTTEAQPILQQRKNNTVQEAEDDVLLSIAGLLVTMLAQGNAIYVTPGRFGGVSVKVYIDGEQYAENVPLGKETDDLVEEILDALYTTQIVAWYRARFGAGRAERAPAARSSGQAVVRQGGATTAPQKGAGGPSERSQG